MKRCFLLSFLLILAIVGCKKNSAPDTTSESTTTNGSVAGVYLLSSYKNTRNGQSTSYKYDTKNRLVDVITNFPSNTEQKLTYDANDKLIKNESYVNGVLNETDTYTYNTGSILVNIVTATNTGSYTSALDTYNRVIKTSYTSIYQSYTYDAAGNIVALANYPTPTATNPSYTYSYTYDNHKSPFLNRVGNCAIAFSNLIPEVTNNISSYVYTSTTTPSASSTVYYTYQYNAAGYPTNRTSVIASVIGAETFTYIQP